VKVGQETYLIGGWQENARVTGPDGMAALLFMERNFDHQARAVAHMPNGQTLRFPVQGTTRRNAVMTATDNSDLPVFRIRRVRSTGLGPERKNRIEIVVEPGSKITTELLLAMVAGYQNLDSFFDSPSGGQLPRRPRREADEPGTPRQQAARTIDHRPAACRQFGTKRACQLRAHKPGTLTSTRTTTKPVLTSIAAVECRPGIDVSGAELVAELAERL
jgi:hypothetical protein